MNETLIVAIVAALWLMTVLWAVLVIGITIQNGHVFQKRSQRPAVKPVSWFMVAMQLVSFVMALVAFLAYGIAKSHLSSSTLALCERWEIPAAILVIVLVLAEPAFMYVQAQHAHESTMDEILGNSSSSHTTDSSELQ